MSCMTAREQNKTDRRARTMTIMELAHQAGLAEPWRHNGVTLAYIARPQPEGHEIQEFAELVAKAAKEGKL